MAKKIIYSKRDIKQIKIIIGANLKRARENAGMTQTDVMKALWGVSNNRNRISEIETGKKDLTLLDILTFQNLYGQSIDYMCGLSIEPEVDMIAGTANNVVNQCRNLIEMVIGDISESMVTHIKSISKNDHEALLQLSKILCDTVRSQNKLDRASPEIVAKSNDLLSLIYKIESKMARQVNAIDMQMAHIKSRLSDDTGHRMMCDRDKAYQYSIPIISPRYISDCDEIEDAYVVGGTYHE